MFPTSAIVLILASLRTVDSSGRVQCHRQELL